jgi:hypothetical protein
MKKENIIAMAQSRIKAAEASLAEFAAKLVKDPEHTVHWSTGMFGDTANLYAWKLVLNMAESDCTLAVMTESLKDTVVGSAVRPASSSNFAANHLEQEKLRAVAEILRDFERRLRILVNAPERPASPTESNA